MKIKVYNTYTPKHTVSHLKRHESLYLCLLCLIKIWLGRETFRFATEVLRAFLSSHIYTAHLYSTFIQHIYTAHLYSTFRPVCHRWVIHTKASTSRNSSRISSSFFQSMIFFYFPSKFVYRSCIKMYFLPHTKHIPSSSQDQSVNVV